MIQPTFSPPICQRDRYGVPRLWPMPSASFASNPSDTPTHYWATCWHMSKRPLIISANAPSRWRGVNLDSMLSAIVLRHAGAYWYGGEREAWVTPLPFALLSCADMPPVVGKKRYRLPVWAISPLDRDDTGRLSALCIGNKVELERLLGFMREEVNWQVEPADMSETTAIAAIRALRPVPHCHDTGNTFTPPYWYNWQAKND